VLRVTCSSQDSRYDEAEQTANSINEDVRFIRIQRFTPVSGTVSFVGTQVTIEGENFDYPGLRIFVDAVEVTGPPVFRSILINETSGQIVEVLSLFWLRIRSLLTLVHTPSQEPGGPALCEFEWARPQHFATSASLPSRQKF
jgi:hypothetical protein